MRRIVLISLISLIVTSLPISIAAGLQENSFSWVIHILIMLLGTAIIPTLLSAWIFFLLVKKTDINKIRTGNKIKIALLFILICETLLTLWAIADWLTSGNLTWRGFAKIYLRDFAGWNYVLILDGILIPFLYFNRFLLRTNSQSRQEPNDQTAGNE